MVVSRTPSMSHPSSLKVSRSELHHKAVTSHGGDGPSLRLWNLRPGLVGGDWDQDDGAGFFV